MLIADSGSKQTDNTDLQRFAGGEQTGGPRMQHWSAVAKAHNPAPIEQMRIDARHLRRHVGPQAQRTARQLVDQLEGAQFQVVRRSGQQRIDVLQQRRHDQFIAVRAIQVEQTTAKLFDRAGFGGKDVGNALGK